MQWDQCSYKSYFIMSQKENWCVSLFGNSLLRGDGSVHSETLAQRLHDLGKNSVVLRYNDWKWCCVKKFNFQTFGCLSVFTIGTQHVRQSKWFDIVWYSPSSCGNLCLWDVWIWLFSKTIWVVYVGFKDIIGAETNTFSKGNSACILRREGIP